MKLTIRCVLTFLALDVVFNPIVTPAFTSMLGVTSAGAAYSVLAATVLLKILFWAGFLTLQLRPFERYAQARTTSRLRLVAAADAALQSFPMRFGSVYALSWSLAYGLGYAGMLLLGPKYVPLGPGANVGAILVVVAVWFGGFAFGLPLASMLSAGAAGECSVFARERGIPLDRVTMSLQVRIGAIALSLGLGPTLWLTALGYMKQVEGWMEQAQVSAALAASELARAVEADRSPQAPQGDRVELLLDDRGAVVAGTERDQRLLDRARDEATFPDLQRPSGAALLSTHWSVAHRRLADGRVALALVPPPRNSGSGFALSAGIFAVVVGLWAPLCAVVLGRAVAGPIERLTNAAREVVEEGKQSEMDALPVPRNDEVGVLSERFNDLLDMMRDLSRGADAIAKGDLTVRIDRQGELPDAFRGMVAGLVGMVQQMRATSVDLAGAAAEIFAASQEQEAAATSQSSAMEEINRTMDSLSESAAHVSDSVQGVLSNAEQTLQNTDEMVTRIGQLSAHAGRIGEILDVIREIAERSDLLALNGSLEASRAGEGGQGFALVAAEMRQLAVRVTASVEDVKKLVTDIRDSGSSTVMATEQSKRLAESTTDAARQITFVTQQQRSGTEQVSQSVRSITEIVTQAVSATAQTRTSAEGLKLQADKLSELVRRFEVTVEAA